MSARRSVTRRVEFSVFPEWGSRVKPWHAADDESVWAAVADELGGELPRVLAGQPLQPLPPCQVLTEVVVTVATPHRRTLPTSAQPVVACLLDALVPHRHVQGRPFSRSWFADPERTRGGEHKITLHLTLMQDDERHVLAASGDES